MYRYLVFDLDGTLIDSLPEIVASLNHALSTCGLAEITDGRDMSWFVGPPLRDGFRRLVGANDDTLVERLVAAYRERYARLSLNSRLYPGIRELISRLSKRRTLALVTTKPTIYASRILEHLELNRSFGVVLGCEPDGTRSSKGELLACIIDEYGAPPSDYLYVGDRGEDVVGARKNRIDSVAVLYGYGGAEEIGEARPKYTAKTVKDLARILTTLTE